MIVSRGLGRPGGGLVVMGLGRTAADFASTASGLPLLVYGEKRVQDIPPTYSECLTQPLWRFRR